MPTTVIGTREVVSRFRSIVERRAPESSPWSASLGGILLGGAMLYHVSVAGDAYVLPKMMFKVPQPSVTGSVTLSTVLTAALLVVGIGSLVFAGWIRVTTRSVLVFDGTVTGALISIGYVLLLDVFTPADYAYPLLHSYRVAILASVLFGIAFISVASPGTWREPRGLQRVLVGADPRRLIQWGVAGCLLLVVGGGVTAISQQPFWPGSTFVGFEILKDILEDGGLLAAAIIASPLAVYAGSRRAGLLASWILIAGLGCGTWGALIATNDDVVTYFRWSSPVSQIWEFSTAVIVAAVIFGTIGYILGVVIRDIQSNGVPIEVAIRR